LPRLVLRLFAVLEPIGVPAEVIIVNDGSRDGTWQVIEDLATRYPFLVGINLMRNYGQQNAQLCGIRAATGSVIVTIDDDLQNPPEEIPQLLKRLSEGYDVVYGEPETRKHSNVRNWSAVLSKTILSKLCGQAIARDASDFRAFWTDLREAFPPVLGSRFSLDALLSWSTSRFSQVYVRQDTRYGGRSNYSLRRLVLHFLNLMTGFSSRPLHAATAVGVFLATAGCAGFAYLLLTGKNHDGQLDWRSLAAVLGIFSGAQMIFLGILGEYVARMHFVGLRRPDYVIRSSVHSGDTAGLSRSRSMQQSSSVEVHHQ
jgi:glycosyltransferase involved in cell wall biosynthesis